MIGNEIYVWKVDWQGKEANYYEAFFPDEKVENTTTQTSETEDLGVVDLSEESNVKIEENPPINTE